MEIPVRFSQDAVVFHGRALPEPGKVVGYAAIIEAMELPMPIPMVITMICAKHKKYTVPGWQVLTPKHAPGEDLYKQLVFALKYEGVDLLFFKKLFTKLSRTQMEELVRAEPSGQYSRRLWFLYEWLIGAALDLPDADVKTKYVALVDPDEQFTIEGSPSPRHRILNNLPGTVAFCPMVRCTAELKAFAEDDIAGRGKGLLGAVHKDVMQRASAFLLLKDSKASFAIEGESPKSMRATRWGQAIGQAGLKELNDNELLRLQQLVIGSDRFVKLGYRQEGGFVGDRDRDSHEPIPDHISANSQDLEELMNGLFACAGRLEHSAIDPVVSAAIIAFGFVFIHPFVDGNGRLHRYLIHHMLARKHFAQQGVVFPISAAILDHINDYRTVLEAHSHPLLDWIVWKETADHNVEVRNDTADYYRYFDATPFAEFLYRMVTETIDRIIPEEVDYLQRHDRMRRYLEDEFNMPNREVDLLIGFLRQGRGRLSQRATTKEFAALRSKEVAHIEARYREIFGTDRVSVGGRTAEQDGERE